MNEPAEHMLGIIELYEYLKSKAQTYIGLDTQSASELKWNPLAILVSRMLKSSSG